MVSSNSNHLWNTGDTTQSITITVPGNYNITFTSANGCPAGSDSIIVTVNSLPSVNLENDTVIYSGDSLLLNASNAGALYIWSTGETSQAITVDGAATYWVSVSNVNGCVDTDSISVVVSLANSMAEGDGNKTNTLIVYPNPADKILNVAINYDITDDTTVVIYNSLGQKQYELSVREKNYKLDITDKAPGVYFIQLLNKKEIISTHKWLVE